MNYIEAEKNIANILRDSVITFNGQTRKILIAEKPVYSSGEGKTDIYCRLDDGTEIKISYKKDNADFLENKLTAKRAQEIFGDSWKEILINSITPLIPLFEKSQIYFPEKKGRIYAGSYTMGWRCDLIKRKPIRGESLTTPLVLTKEQKKEIFFGTNLDALKRNAKIIDTIVPNSGVANYFLVESINENTAQGIIDNLISIDDIDIDVDITFRRVNYRSIEDKIDGNRPLAVYVDWKNNKLVFNHPLEYGAKNDVLRMLKETKKFL